MITQATSSGTHPIEKVATIVTHGAYSKSFKLKALQVTTVRTKVKQTWLQWVVSCWTRGGRYKEAKGGPLHII